jgi:pimeloyl-CoA synthetase
LSNGLVKAFVVSALEREKGTDTFVEYKLETVMESEKCIALTRAVRLQYLLEVHVFR